jgi:hypothetical protein
MSKYRTRIWCDSVPNRTLSVTANDSCSLCVLAKCLSLKERYAISFSRPADEIAWTVEYLDGGINGWNIIYHYRRPLPSALKVHACKPTGPRTVRTGRDFEWAKCAERFASIQAGWRPGGVGYVVSPDRGATGDAGDAGGHLQ